MDMSGKWEGVLTYGKGYEQFAGERLWFELDMEQTKNQIVGVAQDIKGFGLNEYPADVLGSVTQNQVEFSKVYQKEKIFNELWESEYTEYKSIPVEYSGTYDVITGEFNGVWKITERFKVLLVIPWKVVSAGTWSMKRKA